MKNSKEDKCGCGRMWNFPGGHASWCPRLDLQPEEDDMEARVDVYFNSIQYGDYDVDTGYYYSDYDPED